jgi:hypothetical protein
MAIVWSLQLPNDDPPRPLQIVPMTGIVKRGLPKVQLTGAVWAALFELRQASSASKSRKAIETALRQNVIESAARARQGVCDAAPA